MRGYKGGDGGSEDYGGGRPAATTTPLPGCVEGDGRPPHGNDPVKLVRRR